MTRRFRFCFDKVPHTLAADPRTVERFHGKHITPPYIYDFVSAWTDVRKSDAVTIEIDFAIRDSGGRRKTGDLPHRLWNEIGPYVCREVTLDGLRQP